ncbi:MAG: 1-acyl-sn-glycerol-3-phosphate acyltransferase [Bacteroidota bacterium]|nr:1-acyl-sn-glycerol-3-phosphate acyltransferase [Bacteroidota bacterium]
MSIPQNKFIDIDKVLREKAPGLNKWMPGFVLRWLKRKLHEQDINNAMVLLKDAKGLDFNTKGLDFLGAKIVSVNKENLPVNERIIVASNHPLGGLDGMSLIKAVGDIRPDVRFFVNDVLLTLKNYGEVFVGINKVGSTSAASLRTMEDILNSQAAVLFFPAGLVSRKIDGQIVDLPWKKSFVTQAIDHKRLIVPTFIEGENSKFFYRFANFRKFIGIKANIEMLLLPDEMFKQKGHTVKIHFGKPFDPSILSLKLSHRAWAAEIKKYIYSEEFKKGIDFSEYIKLRGLDQK